MTEYREVNLSDLHIPYHDPYAWELALEVVKAVKPTKVNLLGDMLDFYKLSNFDKNPARVAEGGLQQDLDIWKRMFCTLAEAAGKSCRFTFLPGNHEDRLRRYLWKHPELYGLRALELPALMELNELGIEYHEHEIVVIPGELVIKHGDIVRKGSGDSAKAELAREHYAFSTITGHTHRLGVHYVTSRGRTVKAVENGCLCSLTPEFVTNPNWQQGLTVTYYWEKDNFHRADGFHIADVPFIGHGSNMECVFSEVMVNLD